MTKVLVLYNSELDYGVFKKQYESYVSAFSALGISAEALPTSAVPTLLSHDDSTPLCADAIIYLDKDLYCAGMLESKGLNLYNSAECIRTCDDKALTYLALCKNRLPIPKTITAPKTYNSCQSEEWCDKASAFLGFPLIIKECFGSLGKQVYLVHNRSEMLKKVKEIGTKPFVFQEFLPDGAGWDIRVIVADGEIVGAIKRSNLNDFRANAALGGSVEPFELSPDMAELAIAAADSVGAFFAGVDLIRGKDGFLVCEVNSNMLFEAADKALGISTASVIAQKVKKHSLNK